MMSALAVGDLFANRYRVVRCIARGGMGSVYEVVHVETERHHALKVMLPTTVDSNELRDRFKREARVAASVESDFIVDVFDAGVEDTTQMPFLVMELLRGEELGKRLERVVRFEPNEVVTYLHQTALALDKTHKRGIIHRDLKPENLFLVEREDSPPRIKVLDFGIAKLIADGTTPANATQSMGTPLYMSPEQFRTDGRVTAQSDIYALGMMAFTMLVGSPYWENEADTDAGVYAFAVTVMNGPKEPATKRASERGVTLPPDFDAWFARACAFDAEARFPSATAAVHHLADALSVLAPEPRLSDPPGRERPNSAVTPLRVLGSDVPAHRRHSKWLGVAAGVGALSCLALLASALRVGTRPAPPSNFPPGEPSLKASASVRSLEPDPSAGTPEPVREPRTVAPAEPPPPLPASSRPIPGSAKANAKRSPPLPKATPVYSRD